MMHMPNLLSKPSLQRLLFVAGIVAISLLAIQPFTLNQMPETADGLLHLYRGASVDYALKIENPLWSRFTTGIVYGYGAPLYNYFPPLSYYPVSWFHTLGLTFVQSWLMTMVLFTVLSAIGMFLLGRLWTHSNVGGWISAIAYIYAPYFLFDSVARGTSSELGALSILPFTLYGFTRLAFYGRRFDLLFAVGAYALFIPMHTIMTLHGTLLIGVYCLFLLLISEDRKWLFFRLLLAGGLALGLTTFFWMPAFLETGAVKINLIVENLNQIDVTRHLRPLHEILAPPFTADPTQMAQPVPITLSWVQLIVSAFGLTFSWKYQDKVYRKLLIFLWLILGALIFMNMPESAWFWENIPLIGYTQFAWRIMGLASLVMALMTAISVWLIWMRLPSGKLDLAVFCILSLILMTYSIPWTYSLYLPEISLNDIRDVHQFERDTGQLTVSSYSEYLPISTDESLLDADRLVERFEQSDVIPRLLESNSVEILSADWGPMSGRLTIVSSEVQTLIFDWLFVDGWQATVNGENVKVFPSSPVGLVAINVPKGDINLDIQLLPTKIQSLSVSLSSVSVGGIVVVLVLFRFIGGYSNLNHLNQSRENAIVLIVIAVGLSVFLLKAGVLDRLNSNFRSERFRFGIEQGLEKPLLTNFGDQIDLLGVDLGKTEIQGDIVPITLYWRLHDQPISEDYSSIVRMVNASGSVISEAISFQPGGLATRNWLSGAYVADKVELKVPKFTAPLDYNLQVGLFNPETQVQLSIINDAGNPVDIKVGIGKLRYAIQEPKSRFNVERAEIYQGSSVVGLYLQKPVSNLPDRLQVGDSFSIVWTWQKTDIVMTDFRAQVVWVNDNDTVVGTSSSLPLVSGYPFSEWKFNEVSTGYHQIIVPADIPAGMYSIGIQRIDGNGNHFGDPIMIDQEMGITVPLRVLDLPSSDYTSYLEWDNGITLVGYDVDDSGEVRLVWQTHQLLNKNLRLFVHLLDDEDRILSVSDGIPVDWTRPTTGWIPEEYITTEHSFVLPEASYRVRVGWYDPVTNGRIGVNSGDSLVVVDSLKLD